MGLGRKLMGIKEEAAGTPSIIRILDKEITKYRPAFSPRIVKAALRDFSVKLDAKENFHVEFSKLWSAVNAKVVRESAAFHPSELMNACPRKLYYDITEVVPTDVGANAVDARIQMIFDLGDFFHLYIQTLLLSAGILEEMEAEVVNKKLMLEGHSDGILKFPHKRAILEIKTINARGFAQLKTKAKVDHIYQASIYAVELGMDEIVFLYINKDTCEKKEFFEPVNKEAHANAVSIITGVQDAAKKGVAPERVCIDKLCQRSLTCIYHTHCWKKSK